MQELPKVFVSYAHTDFDLVRPVVNELRNRGIDTWMDVESLMPGVSWQNTINEAIQQIEVMLVFVSPESVRSHWILRELSAALEKGVQIIPILLRQVSGLPPQLAELHYLDMTWHPPAIAAKEVAADVARILSSIKSAPASARLPDRQRENLAAALAAQARGEVEQPKRKADKPPDTIFIVHGHDEEFLREVEEFLLKTGIKPIIMKDVGGASASLIQKFFEVGEKADFAIILLSGDDMGASRIQYEMPDVGPHSLKYRARQNVTLELGFFYGKLGWENVFVLERDPPKRYPDFERHSDLNGVLFDRYDKTGRWRNELHRSLAERGFSSLPKM
jgi:predicted nucleotide-binding protein